MHSIWIFYKLLRSRFLQNARVYHDQGVENVIYTVYRYTRIRSQNNIGHNLMASYVYSDAVTMDEGGRKRGEEDSYTQTA